MRATAIARPNIALIKYWGKRDTERNLPAVGSISITLCELFTRMAVEFDAALEGDELRVNGKPDDAMRSRLSACLDRVAGVDRLPARITSEANFPIAAGLASSASAFAALTVAGARAAGLDFDTNQLASLAGHASGSAARSLLGGFVELENIDDDIAVRKLASPEDWPLEVVVAITATGPKAIGSTEAMELSRRTSPFYGSWISQQPGDLDTARAAIEARDFASLAVIAEHNCLKMHSVMWASRPPLVYWNAATIRCLETVRRLRDEGVDVFFTIDAGPQVKAVCDPAETPVVRSALQATEGVVDVMVSGLGAGASLEENAE